MSTLLPRVRLMGLDVGTRRIGVALSDETVAIAFPEPAIVVGTTNRAEADAIAQIRLIAQRTRVERIVVGIPRNMRGAIGVQAQWTLDFVGRLRDAVRADGIAVSTYDERMTSVEAARAEQGVGKMTAKGKRDARARGTVDSRAAALILQGYLDRNAFRREMPLDGTDDNS